MKKHRGWVRLTGTYPRCFFFVKEMFTNPSLTRRGFRLRHRKCEKSKKKSHESRKPLRRKDFRVHLFYQHMTKIPENLGFRGFFVAKSYFAGWLKISDPHRDPHAEMKQRNQWTQEWRTGKWASCPAHFSFCRYRTCSMKLPMAAAASFCFCLVALV